MEKKNITSLVENIGLWIVCCMLLLTPLVVDYSLAERMVMGKVFWFHLAMGLCSAYVLLMGVCGKIKFPKFTVPDFLVCAFAVWTLLFYDWFLNPEMDKLLFGGQLLIFWFLFRALLNNFHFTKLFFFVIIISVGIFEALWGLAQIYGIALPQHTVFILTGSFYNPGPYSGLLSVVFPIGMGVFLKYKKGLHSLALLGVLAILIMIPSGMSRTAWLGMIVSSAWIYWHARIGWHKTRMCFIKYSFRTWSVVSVSVILLSGVSWGLYHIKKDSADGRLLLWKVSALTINEHPIGGTGLGGFSTAYMQKQADYFQSGKATEQEQFLASTPRYAFNEYLQIGVEQGYVGLLLFCSFYLLLILRGIKSHQIEAVGGLLSLAVFAFASYPFQLPSFWILFLSLGGICLMDEVDKEEERHRGVLQTGLAATASCFCVLFLYLAAPYYHAYKEWGGLQIRYYKQKGVTAIDGYKRCYPLLKHNPDFLFEYAQCLIAAERPQEAIPLLNRARRLNGDPIIGDTESYCLQVSGRYEEAEALLIQSTARLPERIHPYFRLVKLYAEPNFYQPAKLLNVAETLLGKEPKVFNPFVAGFREEVKQILIEKHL